MKISIISDTHGFLDDQIIRLLKDSDEIWHAGDIGSLDVIDQIDALSGKFRAVYGNIDGNPIRIRTSEYLFFEIDRQRILITHIANKPPKFNVLTRDLIRKYAPSILVCGHSHLLKVENVPTQNLLFINPGACGHHGFHIVRTIIQFEIINSKPRNMQVIELGKRGRLN